MYKNLIYLILVSIFFHSLISAENMIRTVFDSAKTLEIDFNSMRIGTAEYTNGPTGCTVFYFPKGAQCAVDQRGGFSGTFMLGDGSVSYTHLTLPTTVIV